MSNLEKKFLGIDISDKTIELVELVFDVDKISVLNSNRLFLPPGFVSKGVIKDRSGLESAIKSAIENATPNKIETREIIFGLPDSQTFIHVFNVKAANRKKLELEINKEVETTIPIRRNNLLYEYRIVKEVESENKKIYTILLVAVKKSVILEWENFFRTLGLSVKFFDIEPLASFRAIFNSLPDKPIAMLDFGSIKSSLSIFDAGGLVFNFLLDASGDEITKNISKNSGKSFKDAEKLKKEEGLKNDDVSKAVNNLLKEVKTHIDFFEKKYNQKVDKIILSGGSSRILGLSDYFSEKIGLHTDLAKSFLADVNLRYIGATGLALAGLQSKWRETDPFIPSFFGGKEDRIPGIEKIEEGFSFFKERRRYFYFLPIILIFFLFFYFKTSSENDKIDEYLPKNNPKTENVPDTNKPIENVEVEDVEIEEKKVLVKIKKIGYNINIRSGPGTDYEIVGSAKSENEYVFLEEKNNWTKIELEGVSNAWISSDFIEK